MFKLGDEKNNRSLHSFLGGLSGLMLNIISNPEQAKCQPLNRHQRSVQEEYLSFFMNVASLSLFDYEWYDQLYNAI